MTTIRFLAEPCLTQAHEAAAKKLISRVHQNDGSRRDPYLNNDFNTFKEMPAFFLAFYGPRLVGLLTLYADESPQDGEVDVTINVLPEFRRRKIAQHLWRDAKRTLKRYGYEHAEFLSEHAFLKQNPNFLTKTKLQPDEISEFQLVAPSTPKKSQISTDPLQVRLITEQDIPNLLPVYMAAFDETDGSGSARYLKTAVRKQNGYVALLDGETIGYSAVDFGDYNYLFGLFIAEKYRGQGLGTRFVHDLMVKTANQYPFKLGVDSDNIAAIKIYQHNGFETETQLFYLTAQEGPWAMTSE